MFAIEILHTYAPDTERREAAKVYDLRPEHLSYAERIDVEAIRDQLERTGHGLSARAMQHVGPVGDALEFGATIASAGEAVCNFILNRALMNPHELAHAKVAISECWKEAVGALNVLDGEEARQSMAGLDFAGKFLERAAPLFVPLFEDLERHARKRFPHLGPQLDEGGTVNV